jgi:hypothetical protein
VQATKTLVSRRLDRMLYWRRVSGVLLILGWFVVLLGLATLFTTFRYTPQELASIVANRPSWFMNPFWLLPAPAYFRIVSGAMVLVGFLLVAVASVSRND